MKKSGLLNQPLSRVIAGMGHTDTVVIADAGLPIPNSTERIDLAVTQGIPVFLDVVRGVLAELKIEEVVIASELEENSPKMYADLMALVGDVEVTKVPHETFKQRTEEAKAVVRTGEFTPYSNVIFVAGVTF